MVELGSIAEAARRLDMTPATIAQRVRALEAGIGSQLIVRSGRTVKPTVAGTRILERARSVLREVSDLESAASDTDLPVRPLAAGGHADRAYGHHAGGLEEMGQALPRIGIYMEPAGTTVLYGRPCAAGGGLCGAGGEEFFGCLTFHGARRA